MAAEVEHGLAAGTFGLEQRLTPRLVELARHCLRERTFRQAAGQAAGWRPLLDSLAPHLTDCVPEVAGLEERLAQLRIC